MKVFFTSPTKQDQKELEDAGLKASLLDGRVKIVAVFKIHKQLVCSRV